MSLFNLPLEGDQRGRHLNLESIICSSIMRMLFSKKLSIKMGLIHKVRLDEPDFIFHRSVFMRFAASVFRSSWCISFLVILDGKVLLIATLPVFRRHRYWKNSYFQAIFEAWIKNATGGDLRPEKKKSNTGFTIFFILPSENFYFLRI